MNRQLKQDLLKKFGKRLAYTRSKKRLSLRHLAAASQVDPSDILKYENGAVNPTLAIIGQLARGLGVHPRDLLDFEIDWQTDQVIRRHSSFNLIDHPARVYK